jgi:hypothetical protein
MKSKATKFHFNGEYTDYTKHLGALCPDKYDRDPEKGDTVEVGVDFLGVTIEKGIIAKKLPESKQMVVIREKLVGYEGLDDEDNEYIDKVFDFSTSFDFGSHTRGFSIKFSEKVSPSFVTKNLGGLGDYSAGKEVTSGKMKAKVFGTVNDGYYLQGELKGFIDGDSVVSTKDMDAYKKFHATKTDVENVAWSDRALTPKLIDELNSSLDEICRNEPADYHPGSGKVVRDIVHPSMYCYVKGVSKVQGTPGNPLAMTPQAEPDRSMDKDFWGRDYEDSIYQWLPAEFFVSEQGAVEIKSYVNNLDRAKYPGMYSTLERMFEQTLPMFEAVCGSLRNDFYGVDGDDLGKKSMDLRNRTLQVVTKIVEYRVNHEENFDGVWHVEGMSHEEVLATALCIVKRDENFSGAEIEFRRFLYADEGDDLISSTPQNANRPTDTMGGGDVRPLGCLKTPANRVVVFPNSHIHRLSSMYSSDGNDAVRRIVVFWLVNPERPIVSTANVSPQQEVMTLDEAQRNRLALMAERKLHKESFEEREVFLCEH